MIAVPVAAATIRRSRSRSVAASPALSRWRLTARAKGMHTSAQPRRNACCGTTPQLRRPVAHHREPHEGTAAQLHQRGREDPDGEKQPQRLAHRGAQRGPAEQRQHEEDRGQEVGRHEGDQGGDQGEAPPHDPLGGAADAGVPELLHEERHQGDLRGQVDGQGGQAHRPRLPEARDGRGGGEGDGSGGGAQHRGQGVATEVEVVAEGAALTPVHAQHLLGDHRLEGDPGGVPGGDGHGVARQRDGGEGQREQEPGGPGEGAGG